MGKVTVSGNTSAIQVWPRELGNICNVRKKVTIEMGFGQREREREREGERERLLYGGLASSSMSFHKVLMCVD